MAEFPEFADELSEEVEHSLEAAERPLRQAIDTNSPAAANLGSPWAARKGGQKRTMPDSRVVSADWGGGWARDGTKKKKPRFECKEAKKAREKELEAERAARRKAVRERFVRHRDRLEKARQWEGPRKFEEWLSGLAEKALGGTEVVQLPPAWKLYVKGLKEIALDTIKRARKDADMFRESWDVIERAIRSSSNL